MTQPPPIPATATVNQQPTLEQTDSLFAQQPNTVDEETPWWQKNFLLQQPTLVNAWNAVFPTVVVNIFGIVIFLRMGWIVGTAGLFQAIVVLALCTLFSSITVLSAIGICERCQVRSGGIYFLVSHVLGKHIGGAVGIIYTFGQACATSLVALGFGESMAKLAGLSNTVALKTLSVLVLIVLNALNFAGLRFIIRLQLLLMCFLAMAIGDFLLGAVLFTPQNADAGIGELSAARLSSNWNSHYGTGNCTAPTSSEFEVDSGETDGDQLGHQESFFSVFGILFANFIGVLAGVNMSGNLVDPLRNIAEGELTGLGASFGLCFLIMLILGASVDRHALLCDVMIAERLSLTKLIFMGGLYIACLSAILSSTLGTSRVVQGIAAEGLIPQMSKWLQEDSPNKDPLKATVLVTAVAVLLVLLGDFNQMAILSSMPFLLTYAFVNYAYVSLAMSDDLDLLSRECAAGNGQQTNYGSLHDGLGSSSLDFDTQQRSLDALFSSTANEDGRNAGIRGWDGAKKPWYTRCINRYVSFGAAIMHLLVLLFINTWYALFHGIAFVGLYFYLGKTCPAVSDQGISRFSIVHMTRVALSGMDSFAPFAPSANTFAQRSVVPQPQGLIQSADLQPTRLNEENADYSLRKQYHHAEQLR